MATVRCLVGSLESGHADLWYRKIDLHFEVQSSRFGYAARDMLEVFT